MTPFCLKWFLIVISLRKVEFLLYFVNRMMYFITGNNFNCLQGGSEDGDTCRARAEASPEAREYARETIPSRKLK